MRPWYPFYPSDYQADTKFLSPMADLVYRRLLDLYWMNQGPILLNYAAISRAISLDTRVVKRYLAGELINFWVVGELTKKQLSDSYPHSCATATPIATQQLLPSNDASHAYLINQRMQAEIEKSKEIQESRAKAGKQGGLAKAKANAVASALAPQSPLHIGDISTKNIDISCRADEKPERKPRKKNNNAGSKKEAVDIIEFLNERCGKNFQLTKTNLNFVIARLNEGATPDQCRQVIAMKNRTWGADPQMREYLRPSTLFNATKFNQYTGELDHE